MLARRGGLLRFHVCTAPCMLARLAKHVRTLSSMCMWGKVRCVQGPMLHCQTEISCAHVCAMCVRGMSPACLHAHNCHVWEYKAIQACQHAKVAYCEYVCSHHHGCKWALARRVRTLNSLHALGKAWRTSTIWPSTCARMCTIRTSGMSLYAHACAG